MNVRLLGFLLAAAALLVPAMAEGAPSVAPQIITLGTMAGPMASADRAQPATLLRWPGGMVLVDAGDGVTDQMAKAGIDPVIPAASVRTSPRAASEKPARASLLCPGPCPYL